MKLPRSGYIAEHVRLVQVLRHPTASKLKREARLQAEDLEEARS